MADEPMWPDSWDKRALAAEARVAELEAENAALSAHQCTHGQSSDHGQWVCLARASRLPHHSGDGYAWGGGAVLTIGPWAVAIGEGHGSFELAKEIARRWNCAAECKP